MNTDFLHGIIAYPLSPFDNRGQIRIDLFRLHIERLIQSGVHAIAPLGSTGVLPYLSDGERELLTEAAIQQVNGRVPTLVGVSHLTTAQTVHHARFAAAAGASALMVIPMSYWRLTEEEIWQHFEAIAAAVTIPIMVYNNPATGGIDLSPQLLLRLMELPQVCMIKESTGDIQRMHTLRSTGGTNTAFYNGANHLVLDAFIAGARGWCTAAPNLIPEWNLALYDAVVQEDWSRAQTLFYRQWPLLRFMVEKGLPRVIQAGMECLGFDGGSLRAPLQPLAPADRIRLKDMLDELQTM